MSLFKRKNKEAQLRSEALRYHEEPQPGKMGTLITKPTETQRDLALAYSPGVAEPVREIDNNADTVYKYTNKGNLVGVISNGSAVLGLGNVGSLASKPVMEGKVILFKRFAGVDGFDIEVDADTPQAFINTVRRIAPTFGGINLEDIKAPECFEIEQALIEQLDIPVFHDDQHGTAIIIAAALLNALEIKDKKLSEVRVVCAGAGAAGIASMRLLCSLGLKRDNLLMTDRNGVIHDQRDDLNPYKYAFAANTEKRTLAEALEGADVFIGVAGKDMVSGKMLQRMAASPVVFALSNPDPEILPETAYAARDDLIMATGRSDYPNQVNNVLCFPFLFKGALLVRASAINLAMQEAAVHAIAALAKEPIVEEIYRAYPDMDRNLTFGAQYILPKPMDPRLYSAVVTAVAQAAVSSGVARRELPDKL